MIIVGCTSKPEAGDAKELKNFFQKFLYVPAPDYASRLMLWHHFIRELLEKVSQPDGGKHHTRYKVIIYIFTHAGTHARTLARSRTRAPAQTP